MRKLDWELIQAVGLIVGLPLFYAYLNHIHYAINNRQSVWGGGSIILTINTRTLEHFNQSL